jgi:two-component system C4-dicarboxylate transport response regulator DctD
MRVLLVDDEAAVRAALAQTLDLADIPVEAVGGVAAAMKAMMRERPGVIITDMRMGDGDGFQLLELIRGEDADLPVIVLTGHGDVPMAVKAMNGGAYDFIEKPASPGRLVEVVRRALAMRSLVIENRALRNRLADLDWGADELILGDAPASLTYRGRLHAVAAAEADVLVVGETGAGKEGAARAIHALSDRRDGPFIAVNCGALPPEIAASELFGHEAGAFTGASARRIGRFEQANGGVIFLDEIESMPLDLQVRLLRVVQEREVERLGASAATPLDVRLIAATKTDLRAAAMAGRFREDLYYRLDVARVTVPPLRARLQDAPLLFAAFLDQAAARRGRAGPEMTPAIAAAVQAHDWPGNVRELKNVAERFAQGLGLSIGETVAEPTETGLGLSEQVDAFERAVIEYALNAAAGRVAVAAEALGLPRKTLYDKLTRLGVDRSG